MKIAIVILALSVGATVSAQELKTSNPELEDRVTKLSEQVSSLEGAIGRISQQLSQAQAATAPKPDKRAIGKKLRADSKQYCRDYGLRYIGIDTSDPKKPVPMCR